MMERRRLLQLAAGAAASLGASCGGGDEPAASGPPRPNIVFILADDLGYGDAGCYGQQKIRTPHIDRLCAEGMKFTDAYAGAAVCAPARATLMTGLHTGHAPVRANGGGNPILDEDVTVAEVLQQAGYATGQFGKWGLGDIGTTGVPWKQGFDEFFGYLHQVHAHYYYPPYLWKNDEKFALPGNADGGREQYSHDLIVEEGLNFIRNHVEVNRALRAQSSGQQDAPFFAYFSVTIPHSEITVPEDSMEGYDFEEPKAIESDRFPTEPRPRAAYAGMISRLDRDVGRIVEMLKELNIDNETLVIFTSDNGPARGPNETDFFGSRGPFRGQKGTLYEGGIRAPFIARWPGKIEARAVSDLPTAFWDFLPTAAELAGAKPPEGIDGISIVPALLGEGEQKRHRYLYWEHPGSRLNNVNQAVRRGRWKAVRTEEGAPLELYDLAADPGETNNVAASHPDVVAEMEAIIEEAHSEPRPHFRKGWEP